MPPVNGGNGLPDGLAAYADFSAIEDRSAAFAPSLVSLSFIRAAIRRSAWFWCATALVGLLVGFGVYVAFPHSYQASTSLLLTLGPYEDVQTAATDNQAIAESDAVAGLAVHQLGLRQSVASFLASYTVNPVATRVLVITISGSSSNQAVLRARAVATAFLKFRADELQTQQKLVFESLAQQVKQARQNVSSISAQISRPSVQPASSTQKSQLSSLQTERTQATTALANLEQAVTSEQTTIVPATAAAVEHSVMLDAAAPLPHSRLKPLVLHAAIGLFLGLVLGIGIAVIRALVSDRLRQRDEIAHALGAPVKLSVGTIRLNRWLPGGRGRSAVRNADIQRIAAHLGRIVPRNFRGVASLAVVAVDDLQVPALSVVSLAVSCADEGRRVVVADLCGGAPTARLLGLHGTGVQEVSVHGTRFVVAVPEQDEVVAVGPLARGVAQAPRSSFTEAVTTACASANLLLTLASLDPSLGGEHLATWATDAVVVVTAGRASWTRIQGVGEMIRLSGTRLTSAVLVGADKTDESLGMTRMPETV